MFRQTVNTQAESEKITGSLRGLLHSLSDLSSGYIHMNSSCSLLESQEMTLIIVH